VPRFKRFKIVGIFSVGAEVDSMVGYIALNDASTLLRLPDGAQGVRLKVDDIFTAPEVVNQIVKQLPDNFYATSWKETHGSLFSAVKMEKNLVGLLLFLIIVVAAFNIVSSLVMVVTDKKADIAILRTLGASPRFITSVFIVQGTIIGVVGTVIGVILGSSFALTISDLVGWLNHTFGLNLFSGYVIGYLPSYLRWQDVLIVVTASLSISFLATIYPAIRAAKTQPAES
jgi:lipoprotein-releasing system permease protein